jgi:hypothetical protein
VNIKLKKLFNEKEIILIRNLLSKINVDSSQISLKELEKLDPKRIYSCETIDSLLMYHKIQFVK